LTIKYLRRESFSIYPTLLSKTVITADQKVARSRAAISSALRTRNHQTDSPPSPKPGT